MSKELEALEYFYTVSQNGNHPELVEDAYRILKDHLTPPIAEEVCKALQEDCKIKKVLYGNGRFYDEEDNETIVSQCYVDEVLNVNFQYHILNIKSITLIGRFYEGLEGENNATF